MPASYEDRLLRVIDYIHANLDGDLSLDALADVAAMSRFHWHRVFAAMYGETCASAIRRIRLNRAAGALIESDAPVAKIARQCGYANTGSFIRAFGEAYGHPPEAFRRNGKRLPLLFQPQKGEYPMFPIETREDPARKVLALEHIGPYIEIGAGFEKLGAISATRDFWQDVESMVGIFYDDPDATPPEELRSHAGLIMKRADFIAPEELETLTIAPGRVAVMHFKGPYAGLHTAYKHLFGDWLPKSGEELRDAPPYEIYLNTPRDVGPDDLLTDICVPLQ